MNNLMDANDDLDDPACNLTEDDLMLLYGLSPSEFWYDAQTSMFHMAKPCVYCEKHGLRCLIIQTTRANPNPPTSCSSCVALYRVCSLAAGTKRHTAQYESEQPVISNLHGVAEENVGQETPANDVLIAADKKRSSRYTSRNKPLRDWFACHQDHPYPSDAEKNMLSENSGLSRQQVHTWFGNARRRLRHSKRSRSATRRRYVQGSPMPQQSPLEHWRNSPPEAEHCSMDTVQNAISTGAHLDFEAQAGGYIDQLYVYGQADSSSGISSCSSFDSALSEDSTNTFLPHFDDLSRSGNRYPCLFCASSFQRKSDWIRHEKSAHVSVEVWRCCIEDEPPVIWHTHESSSRCKYCGDTSLTLEHMARHEVDSCAERDLTHRKFTRRDHLLQHLSKYHHANSWEGWDWRDSLKRWRETKDNLLSRCGFCEKGLFSWTERYDHLAQHFKNGKTMSDWIGDLGLDCQTTTLIRNVDLDRSTLFGLHVEGSTP